MKRKFNPEVISLIKPSKRFLSLKENTRGRDFVVGDIHGSFDMLTRALLKAKFDPKKDRLISLGDILNKGKASLEALKYLKKTWFFPVLGNHEMLFLEAYNGKKLNQNLIEEKSDKLQWMLSAKKEQLDTLYDHLRRLPFAMEVKTPQGTYAFVHANIPQHSNRPTKWKKFKRQIKHGDLETIYSALTDSSRAHMPRRRYKRIKGIFKVFAGHTPQKKHPIKKRNFLFIDTGAHRRDTIAPNSNTMHLTMADIRANQKDICRPLPKRKKEAAIKIVTTKRRKPLLTA